MKIADLDIETRKLIFCARLVVRDPSPANIKRLKDNFEDWDTKHEQERSLNLINALWGPNGIMNGEDETDDSNR